METLNTYKIFVNGQLFNTTNVYDYAMNRALGIAMFLNLDFVNVESADCWEWNRGV